MRGIAPRSGQRARLWFSRARTMNTWSRTAQVSSLDSKPARHPTPQLANNGGELDYEITKRRKGESTGTKKAYIDVPLDREPAPVIGGTDGKIGLPGAKKKSKSRSKTDIDSPSATRTKPHGQSQTAKYKSVQARFWDEKVPPNDKDPNRVELHFTTDPFITEAVFDQCLAKAMKGLKFQPKGIWKGSHSSYSKPFNFELLGVHFQDLYRVYIAVDQRKRIRNPNYPLPNAGMVERAAMKISPTIRQWANLQKKLAEVEDHPLHRYLGKSIQYAPANAPPWTTITRLTVEKLNEASRSTTRGISQRSAMSNHSATEIASIFEWDDPEEAPPPGGGHRAEWLHRSAFSFGGLGFTNPELLSSQTPRNFIFGSVEANTIMIRPEDTIRRLVRRTKALDQTENVVVTVFTTAKPLNVPGDTASMSTGPASASTMTDEHNQDPNEDSRCVWLAAGLDYTVHIDMKELFGEAGPSIDDIYYQTRINPFSRAVPLMLESRLDELLENEWFEHMFLNNTTSK